MSMPMYKNYAKLNVNNQGWIQDIFLGVGAPVWNGVTN